MKGFISYFQYILDICKSYNNGDIALLFYFGIRQLMHCVRYIGVSFVRSNFFFYKNVSLFEISNNKNSFSDRVIAYRTQLFLKERQKSKNYALFSEVC